MVGNRVLSGSVGAVSPLRVVLVVGACLLSVGFLLVDSVRIGGCSSFRRGAEGEYSEEELGNVHHIAGGEADRCKMTGNGRRQSIRGMECSESAAVGFGGYCRSKRMCIEEFEARMCDSS